VVLVVEALVALGQVWPRVSFLSSSIAFSAIHPENSPVQPERAQQSLVGAVIAVVLVGSSAGLLGAVAMIPELFAAIAEVTILASVIL